MKVVILAGGLGTRLAEETEVRPKPMVEIGGQPLLWHIMKHYGHFGHKEFVVALGHKGESIKKFFTDYLHLSGSFTVDLAAGKVQRHRHEREEWKLHLMETGLETMTGGRLKRLSGMISDGPFLMTYGDGLSNVDLDKLLAFHRAHGKLATVTVVRPPSRFGSFEFAGDQVSKFIEKPQAGEGWISGGFFVLEPKVLDYISGDDTSWEREPMERLASAGQLMAYRHDDFWQCMDTLRDKRHLEGLWAGGRAPWKLWKE